MYKVKMDGYILYHPHHPSTTLSEPILELEPGYAGVFQATIPYDNPLYDKVYCRKSMISVYRDDKEIFYGEVRKIPKVDRLRNKQIYCTGALSFLADSIQPQAEYHDISPATLLGTMLDIHNSQVEERKQIHLGIVTVTDSNIYVPDALLASYKEAENWSKYANQFRAIEDYPELIGG